MQQRRLTSEIDDDDMMASVRKVVERLKLVQGLSPASRVFGHSPAIIFCAQDVAARPHSLIQKWRGQIGGFVQAGNAMRMEFFMSASQNGLWHETDGF